MSSAPFIQNCSLDDVRKAWHYDPGPNGALIQIVDPDMEHPTPMFQFKDILRVKFLDLEEDHVMAIKPHHAQLIATFLKQCKENQQNVVVHCVAGICRSGAVVEAGIALGFRDPETVRIPNIRVKQLILKELS